jgi:dihydroorotate dehydrogenase electron transfer subunit
MSRATGETGPIQVTGTVLGVKRAGAYHQLTVVAPGVAERFRPGTLVSFGVGGPHSARLLRRSLPIFRARPTGAYGGTVQVVLDAGADPGLGWLAAAAKETPVDVVGPLGHPFALPKEPVACVLVAEGCASAPLFPLAERLRERGCAVHVLLGADSEPGLFGSLEARRSTRGVTVTTRDGSLGLRGATVDALPDLLVRTGADVVYAAGPAAMLHGVARVAEEHGAWSQTLVDVQHGCGTGFCLACVLPVVGEDGVTRMLRACADGPVFRGDRVRWDDLGTVPADARGAR